MGVYKLSSSGGLKTSRSQYLSMSAGNPIYTDLEHISTVYGTGSSTTITFTNIPQSYKHLQIRAVARTSYASTSDTFYAYNYNNNTGSTNSSYHSLYATGSGVASSSSTGNFSSILGFVSGANASANSHGVVITDIPDYTSTAKNKTLQSYWTYVNASENQVGLTSAVPFTLPGTGAITSISFICNGNFSTTSRISLYGIRG